MTNFPSRLAPTSGQHPLPTRAIFGNTELTTVAQPLGGPAHIVLPGVEQVAGSFELCLVVQPNVARDLDNGG